MTKRIWCLLRRLIFASALKVFLWGLQGSEIIRNTAPWVNRSWMVALVSSETYCSGCVGNEGSISPKLTTNTKRQICPHCHTHTGKKNLNERTHVCGECGYLATRDHASASVICPRGINTVPVDSGERKQSSSGVLSGVPYLDKCRSRNTQS